MIYVLTTAVIYLLIRVWGQREFDLLHAELTKDIAKHLFTYVKFKEDLKKIDDLETLELLKIDGWMWMEDNKFHGKPKDLYLYKMEVLKKYSKQRGELRAKNKSN